MPEQLIGAPVRHDEAERLRTLHRYCILDTPPEPRFDEITQLASALCDTPIAVINFIDQDRQWFKSEIGLGVRQTPLDVSICAHAILQDDFLEVPDTTLDERFDRNPLVTGEPGLRFYAGALLRSPEGLPLGTLCVLDTRPRRLSPLQRQAMQTLANQVVAQLELHRALRIGQQTECTLRSNEAQLRLALDAARLGTFDWEYPAEQVTWSARTRELMGVGLDEPITRERLLSIVHPEDRDCARIDLNGALDPLGSGEYESEYRVVRLDGTVRWLHARGRAIFDLDAQGARCAMRFTGVVQDVTERREAADQIERARAMLDAVGEATPSLIYLKDRDGRMVYCNAALLQAIGKAREDVIGKTDVQFGGPGPRSAAMMIHDRQVMESGRPLVVEEQFEGVERLYLSTKAPYRDARGEIVGVAGVSVDISDQRRIEQALRDSDERFRLAVESSSLGTFDWDLVTDELILSPQAAAMFGLPSESLPVSSVLERIHAQDREAVEAAIVAAQNPAGTGQYRLQHRIVRPDGEIRWADVLGRVKFVLNKRGELRPVRFAGVLWDTTDQQQLVASLREADARKDEFLAMLAHELRNPLAPLTNALRVLDRTASLTAHDRRLIEMAERQTRQLKRLVDDLLEVARITRGRIELKREPMEIGAAVRDTVASVMATCEKLGHRVTLDLPGQPVRVVADPVRIAQVLENLLNNACKYTPAGGEIRVEVEHQPDVVEIRVIDNGMGIDPAKIGHIFDLFAQVDTTIDRSQGGLGIGLALVKRLVELHGGTATAFSAGQGRGATFTVRLPTDAAGTG